VLKNPFDPRGNRFIIDVTIFIYLANTS
jgi:hypothetical protein